MAFLDEIATRLVAQGVGVLNTSIFQGAKAAIPTGDGPYVSLAETGGQTPTRVQNKSSAATVRPSAQVLVRALTYQAARARAKLAYDALDGVFNTILSGTFYLSITANQEPADMGFDETGRRVRVVFNINTEKEPS